MTRQRSAVAAVVLLVFSSFVSAQKPAAPTLADLQKAGGDYLATYEGKVSGMMLEEQFMLIEVLANQMSTPRRITSDVVLLKINDGLMGLRDVFALDSKAVRERQPRIIDALKDPATMNWPRAQGYTRENAQLFLSSAVLWFSDPVLALKFVAAANQPRLTYKLEGNKKINDVQTYGLGFKEKDDAGAKHLLDVPGNPLSSGRFWIDPATGAIHRTELWIESETDTARIQVDYAPDKALGALIPKEANSTFESREKGTGIGRLGAGGAQTRQQFQTSAKYVNPRYTPIDLSKIRR